MFVIGLTGGIGSGKTTVSDQFAAQGIPVIDADVIARDLVSIGSPALQQIADTFGSEMITADGALDRDLLRQQVFSDSQTKTQLEAILHPRVRSEIRSQMEQLNTSYAIVSIPLLLESAQIDLVDRILVVDVAEQQQIDRTHQRDSLSETEIRAIMSTQASREARLDIADDVLSNDGELAELKAQVMKLHQKYLEMAQNLRPPAK